MPRRGLCSCPEEESDACPDRTEERIRGVVRDLASEAEVEAAHG